MTSIDQIAEKAINLGKQFQNVIEIGEWLREHSALQREHEALLGKFNDLCQARDEVAEQRGELVVKLEQEEAAHVEALAVKARELSAAQQKTASVIQATQTEAAAITSATRAEESETASRIASDLAVFAENRDNLLREVAALQTKLAAAEAGMAAIKERVS